MIMEKKAGAAQRERHYGIQIKIGNVFFCVASTPLDTRMSAPLISQRDAIIEQCLAILKRDDVKQELKNLISPLVELILIEIY